MFNQEQRHKLEMMAPIKSRVNQQHQHVTKQRKIMNKF